MKLLISRTCFALSVLLSGAAVVAQGVHDHAAPKASTVVAKPDSAQGQARFSEVCASCHGADGNSGTPAYPKLAAQHPEYLVKQLQEFKSGKRANPVMSGFVSSLGDADMRNIASWLSAQKAKPGFAKDKEQVALGERIYRGGLADRQIAACMGCHGPTGSGIPVQYPRIAGQHADYIAAQLIAFRDGVRKNNVPMAQVAAKLSDKEIHAVADYLAGLR